MRMLLPVLGAGVAALLLAACHEIPQDVPKAYASKHDSPPYAGALFNGDKEAFEKALAARAQKQNEYSYARVGGANAPAKPS